MRRELKLVLLVFCLVVGPAVVLSFMAGRILENWQVILQKRMEIAAARELDDAVRSWRLRLDNARRDLRQRLAIQSPIQFFSTYSASNAWLSGLFVFSETQGLIYPLGEDKTTASNHADDTSMSFLSPLSYDGGSPVTATNPAAAIREYRQILDQPEGSADFLCRTRLRLAQVYRKAGQLKEAKACVEQVVKDGGGGASWSAAARQELSGRRVARDPEDGFYYDLIALKALSELCDAVGDQEGARGADTELLRRVLDRYETMAVSQRQLATLYLDKRLGETRPGRPTGEREAALLSQWRELKRGRDMDRDLRIRMEQEFLRWAHSGTISDEAWTVTRIGTNEYWVTPAGRPEPPASASSTGVSPRLFFAVQLDRDRLSKALAQSASGLDGDTGVAIEVMGSQEASRGPRPLLAERRMAPPLDRVVLAAYPSDSRAFLANVRLQSRLYGWGGFVLILSVVIGGWLMWREAVHEIRAARERSDFAAAVSHDLRTPLSSMRMLAESLYLGRIEDEGKRKRFLQTILKESDRLSRLTDRALYFIQFGQGAVRYQSSEGDLGGLIKDVVETFATGIGAEVRESGSGKREAGGGRREEEPTWVIDLAISDDLPAARFDAGAMEQVVFNLLDNAVKYSREDRRIEVSVGEDASRRHISVAVKDHGVGIDPGDLKRIFKAYQRGGSSANTAGLGLGLALCRDVVKAHCGKIDVASRLGIGSTFTVVLPAV